MNTLPQLNENENLYSPESASPPHPVRNSSMNASLRGVAEIGSHGIQIGTLLSCSMEPASSNCTRQLRFFSSHICETDHIICIPANVSGTGTLIVWCQQVIFGAAMQGACHTHRAHSRPPVHEPFQLGRIPA